MTNTLYVKAYTQDIYDSGHSQIATIVYFTAPSYYQQPSNSVIIEYGSLNPLASPFPIYPDIAAAIADLGPAQASALVTAINGTAGLAYYTAYDIELVDASVGAAIHALTLDTITEGSTNKYYTSTEKTKLAGINLAGKSDKSSFSAVTSLSAHGVANASAASNPGLPTNFNLVSGVLGIANGLNDANAAQNDLATKYNDLESKFNSILTWLGTTKDKINSTIAAGAA